MLTLLFLSVEALSGPPYAVMRLKKIKSIRAGNKSKEHNARITPCVNIDPNIENLRVKCFDETLGDLTDKTFKEIFDERTKGQTIRKNAVYAIEVVMTFTPGAISEEQLKAWAATSMCWFADLFGKENIIDAILHLDEKTPHIHATAIPIDERGKLNARAFLGGTKKTYEKLQDNYAAAVSSFGLNRGKSKSITRAEHESSMRWHRNGADNEAELKAYKKFVGEKNISLDDQLKLNQYYNEAKAEQQKPKKKGKKKTYEEEIEK